MNLSQLARDILTIYTLAGSLLTQLAEPDVLMVARAVQGEGCGLFNRDECGRYLAHTIMNRWEKSYWREIDGVPVTFSDRVQYDWHGVVNVEQPEPWALAIAAEVVTTRRNGGPDGAEGSLFMLSLRDLEANGWKERAEGMVVRRFVADGGELWFFRRWVGD